MLMKKFYFGVILLIFFLAAGLTAAKRFNDDGVPVKTLAVERGPISAAVLAAGNVVNREELMINSAVSAQILELGAGEGDLILKGKMLVNLDDRESKTPVDKARTALKFAEKNEANAKRSWEHLQKVFEVGGESRKTVEDAELRWQSSQKESRLVQEDLRQALFQLERYHLTAPIAGTITARAARKGAWVKPGDPLFRLAPLGIKEIEVKLDAGDSAAAVIGKTTVVTSDAFPGKEWQEKIVWVAPATNKEGTSNSLSVRISLGKNAPPLVIGQQADVKVATAERDIALKIPSNTIISKQGKPLVAVIVDDRVHLVPISTGIENLTYTEVISGLNEGQKIIRPEGRTLREGDRVKISLERGG